MDKTYKVIEIVGNSSAGFQQAVDVAIKEAAKTLKGLAWFEVKELTGGLKDGKVTDYQARLLVGFRLLNE
ncbi:MAG: dodecin domain-containing protein [candidate division Zixibacteria bacterium]|nr:dodecin domain-containing protein [candidate division Zixibacteria bacterium]